MSTTDDRPALVVGSGPVAMMAALVLARRRQVVLCVGNRRSGEATRIDSLPIQSLAPLVEIGLHPADIGVDAAYERAFSAWETRAPLAITGHPKVHVDRCRLGEALLRLVERERRIRVGPRRPKDSFGLTVDATGRRAALSAGKVSPSPAWIARTWTVRGAFSATEAAFRIAAAPGGYAYRLGNGTCLTLGFVMPAGPNCRTDAFQDALARSGGAWILDGLPPLTGLPAGRGGACSVQWSTGGSAEAIGDARFAADALSAQGLSIGLSEALSLNDRPQSVQPRPQRHVATLRQQIARCRFRHDPAWASYDRWLASTEVTAPNLGYRSVTEREASVC